MKKYKKNKLKKKDKYFQTIYLGKCRPFENSSNNLQNTMNGKTKHKKWHTKKRAVTVDIKGILLSCNTIRKKNKKIIKSKNVGTIIKDKYVTKSKTNMGKTKNTIQCE